MITVIGSSSIDFVVETLRVPERGETLMGENFTTFCGGKGANQAVAIARLGEKIQMIGSVGDDDFGQKILKNLTENGVDTSLMNIAKSTASGSAHIFIEAGDNRIVVVAGANNAITPSYIKQHIATLQQSKVVLIQYEIPRATIEYVASLCQELSIPLIINPAPMKKVSDATLQAATYLTPNEVEAKQLFPDKTLEQIVLEYPEKLIITQGSKGVLFAEDGVVKEIGRAHV